MAKLDSRGNILPKEVSYQCLWVVRDMKRLEELEALSDYAHGTNEIVLYETKNGISREVVVRNAIHILDCVRKAEQAIPECYREGIIDNIISHKEFDVSAHTNTWQKWKRVFLFELARNLMLI